MEFFIILAIPIVTELQNIYFDKAREISSRRMFIKSNFLASRGDGLKYIQYRIYRPLLKGYYKLFNLFKPGRPWTTQASIIFFESVLNKEMIGLEYGSGRSTKFFAERLGQLVSIEHHEAWYKKVKLMLDEANIDNVDYLYIPKVDHPESIDDSEESLNGLTGLEERPGYANYSDKVNEYPDGYFDFVLIDGRSRVNCGKNAIAKLKAGGIFVLDNSERPRYNSLHHALKEWPVVNTTNGLTNTTIWIKP